MKIKTLKAYNFKIFDELELDLQEKSTIIFGENGAGKSTILSVINYLFYIWVHKLNPTQGKTYETFSDDSIHIGESQMSIQAEIVMNKTIYEIHRQYQQLKLGVQKKQQTYDKKLYDNFYENFLQNFVNVEQQNIPIFVNYGTNRSVLDIPLRIRNKHEFGVLSSLERTIENELDFRTFFEWFRNQEDLENEIKLDTGNINYEDSMLKCVRKAIEAMLGNVTDLKVKRNPLCMKVTKGKEEIRVDQLSDGEKCTLALFGDLARRIAIANPYRENPLDGNGIVLIDEIELHMHTSWQRRVLGVLADVFPNIQFIVTTHSPQVLGEADDRYRIVFLNGKDNRCQVELIERMDGFDSNFILEEYMQTSSKNKKVKELIQSVNINILKKEFEQAEKQLSVLKMICGDMDKEVILAEGYLKRSKERT